MWDTKEEEALATREKQAPGPEQMRVGLCLVQLDLVCEAATRPFSRFNPEEWSVGGRRVEGEGGM